VNRFHPNLRVSLFGGAGLCSGEIMGGGEWLEGCGEREKGLVVRGAAVEAKVRPLGCWTTLEDGVVCVGVFVCGQGV